MTRQDAALAVVLAAGTLAAAPLEAAVAPQPARARKFALRHPRLAVPDTLLPLDELTAKPPAVPADAAFYDPHAQRWASLLLHEPLIPGRGVENRLAWPAFGVAAQPSVAEIGAVARAALRDYLRRTTALRIDLAQLSPTPRVTVHDGGRLVQIHVQRTLAGVPVRDSALAAVVNHGNLVLLGLSHWADAEPAPKPDLDAAAARAIVAAHVEGGFVAGATPRLEYVPFARQPPADGYDLRLVWVVEGRIEGDFGAWEGLVDAAAGELLAFEDRNRYAQPAKVVGGVYPLSNDGLPPDGVEQPGFPMPFADVRLPDGSTVFTNSSGVIGCVSPSGRALVPSISTTLAGRYVTISDACGPVNERWRLRSPTAGDLGSGPGTDCAVPPGRHSPGDTHAARTSFYELNRIGEQARGYLPNNGWLQSPLPVNVNPPPDVRRLLERQRPQLLPQRRRSVPQPGRDRGSPGPRVGPRHGRQRRRSHHLQPRRGHRGHPRHPEAGRVLRRPRLLAARHLRGLRRSLHQLHGGP